MRALRIGLVGYYGRGNFGDDLIAAILGTYLVERGHACTVLGLDAATAAAVGVATTGDLPALVGQSDAIVIGGGSLLARPSRARLHHAFFEERGGTCGPASTECARQGTPLFLVSGGGDGTPLARLIPPQREVVRVARAATVRNPEALPFFADGRRSASFHPDLALQASRLFPMSARRADARPVVGIDVYWSNLLAQGALHAAWLLRRLVRRRPDLSFVFLDSTHRDHAPFRALAPRRSHANTARYQFGDLRADLERIASLDLVLSTRLHVGVTALSYGVPFVSLFGEPKTRLFLRHAGLDAYRFGHASFRALRDALGADTRLDDWLRAGTPPSVPQAIAASRGHLSALDTMLASLG